MRNMYNAPKWKVNRFYENEIVIKWRCLYRPTKPRYCGHATFDDDVTIILYDDDGGGHDTITCWLTMTAALLKTRTPHIIFHGRAEQTIVERTDGQTAENGGSVSLFPS